MKTIVEIMNGQVYVYRNTEKHFRRIKKQLTNLIRIAPESLDKECNLSYHPTNAYIVIDGDVSK